MHQLLPDWRQFMTKKQFEKELNVAFNGPGFYLSKTDTVIAIPSHFTKNVIVTEITETTVWNQEWPEDTVFEVCVYNCPFHNTVFSQIALAPTRMITQDD
jgi:hypothetical protein